MPLGLLGGKGTFVLLIDLDRSYPHIFVAFHMEGLGEPRKGIGTFVYFQSHSTSNYVLVYSLFVLKN